MRLRLRCGFIIRRNAPKLRNIGKPKALEVWICRAYLVRHMSLWDRIRGTSLVITGILRWARIRGTYLLAYGCAILSSDPRYVLTYSSKIVSSDPRYALTYSFTILSPHLGYLLTPKISCVPCFYFLFLNRTQRDLWLTYGPAWLELNWRKDAWMVYMTMVSSRQ